MVCGHCIKVIGVTIKEITEIATKEHCFCFEKDSKEIMYRHEKYNNYYVYGEGS